MPFWYLTTIFSTSFFIISLEFLITLLYLLSSLDLLRRIIQLVFSFLFFNEPFDGTIILSLVCLGISSLLLLYEYLKDHIMKKIEHVELVEIIESK